MENIYSVQVDGREYAVRANRLTMIEARVSADNELILHLGDKVVGHFRKWDSWAIKDEK